MRLGSSVLLEILSIVQDGIMNLKDVSEDLRKIEVYVPYVSTDEEEVAELSPQYLKERGRLPV